MQVVVVVALVLVCFVLLGRQMLAKAGIGRPGGKPDCGCGHCDEKQDPS